MTPALFLDRDGVINVDVAYLHRPKDCQFIPGIFKLVRAANHADYRVFVATNQAGIARGIYSEETFHAFTDWMTGEFARHDALIDKIYYCPHHPDAGVGAYKVPCGCRKPQPGMMLKARDEFQIDMRHSIMVGDNRSDIQAAQAAGIGQVYWLSHESLVHNPPSGCSVIYSLEPIISIFQEQIE